MSKLDKEKPLPDESAVKAAEKLARTWQANKTFNNAISMLKSIEEIIIRQADLDKNPMLLNVKNGVVDLETGKLYPAAPELLFTKQANVIFNPAALAVEFENFMQQILPDEMTRAAVLRFLGYCLTGRVNEEKALFVLGEGGNGKSTLFETILYLLGGYATTFDIELILRRRNQRDPNSASPELAKLRAVRFACAPEIPAGREFDLAEFKKYTGKDTFSVRALHQNPFDLVPTAKLAFSGQHTPKVENAKSKAFLRRFLPVVFPCSFDGKNADTTLKDKLRVAEELSGTFNILRAECLKWQHEGLIMSTEMKTAREEYIQDNDFIAKFIDENCELTADGAAYMKDFLSNLKKEYPVANRFTDRELKKMIEEIDGISYDTKVGKKRLRGFRGVNLNKFDDSSNNDKD